MIKENNISFFKKHKEILIALLINIIVLAFNTIFGRFHFVTNDDRKFLDIASGAYGIQYSEFLVFYNIIYGFMLKLLFSITRDVNWYIIIPILLSFISFTSLSYCILRKYSLPKALAWIGMMIPVLSTFFYLKFQWTHNAFLFCGVGLFLLIYANTIDYSATLTFVGILLTWMGFMTRNDCFIAACPIIILGIAVDLLKNSRRVGALPILSRRKRLYCVLSFLIIMLMTTKIIDSLVYKISDNGRWAYHREYNLYRSSLWDYDGIRYDDNTIDYSSIGVTRNTANIFNFGSWSDGDKFTLELLKKIKQINNRDYETRVLGNTKYSCFLIRDILCYDVSHGGGLLYLLLMCVIMLCYQFNKENINVIIWKRGGDFST